MQLAQKIKEYIPKLSITCDEIATDPDKRDYIVSNDKIEATGWRPQFSIDDGIKELIKAYQFMPRGKYKNI
jgi:nucleoside-diphosphate-sugar epimerase